MFLIFGWQRLPDSEDTINIRVMEPEDWIKSGIRRSAQMTTSPY